MSAYQPWLCSQGHRLESNELNMVTGECPHCGGDVVFASNKQEVSEALLEQDLGPDISHVDWKGREHLLVRKECRYCNRLFETPYSNTVFCNEHCKMAERKERLSKRPRCKICKRLILKVPNAKGELVTADRRWKFCLRCKSTKPSRRSKAG